MALLSSHKLNQELIEAARDGSSIEIERLLGIGADPMWRNGHGDSALIMAAFEGHQACVKILLPWSNPDARDNNGYSVLACAAMSGHSGILRLLVQVAEVGAADRHGGTALYWAACLGKLGAAKILMAAGSPLHDPGEHGMTPSQVAHRNEHEEVARAIEAEGPRREALALSKSVGARALRKPSSPRL